MQPHQIYLSLGSNLGDRLANLRLAIAQLDAAGVRVTGKSHIYETEPVDYQDQPWFLNCVVAGETDLEPFPLLHALQATQRKIGPEKETPKGPRVIDLDVLFYDLATITTPALQIPHPRMQLRRFVLVPLAELAPNLMHPGLGATIAQLLERLPDRSQVLRFQGTL